MEQILNLTQHVATPSQVAAGVVEPANKEEVQLWLTAEELPDDYEIREMAENLTRIAKASGLKKVMIGGAPWLMSTLQRGLAYAGIAFVYSFSVRKSVEVHGTDGTVTKTNVFEHEGWVELDSI